ncbi:MAG: DMT family transporter [Patescibacteria group bacterium]|jgi:drug/metabolite transporter (DMT)-like permease
MPKKLVYWYAAMFATYIFWGTQIPALKALSGQVPLTLIVFFRYLMAVLALLPFFVMMKGRKTVSKEDFRILVLLGFLGVALYGILNIFGIKHTTGVNTSIILHTWPLVMTLFAPMLIGEKVGKGSYVGLVLGFAGLVAVVSEGNLSSIWETKYLLGNILIFLSGICIALYTIFNKRFNHKYGGLNVTFLSFATGSVFLFLFSLFSGDLPKAVLITPKEWFLLFWAGVPTLALTWMIWFNAMRKIGLVKANSFFLLIAPAGIFFSIILLGETIAPIKLIGTGLILSGLYIVQTRK